MERTHEHESTENRKRRNGSDRDIKCNRFGINREQKTRKIKKQERDGDNMWNRNNINRHGRRKQRQANVWK